MSNTEQEEEHNKVDVESIESMTHQQQHVHLQSQQHQQLIQETNQTQAIFPIEKTQNELSPPPQPIPSCSRQTTPTAIQRARSTTRKSSLHRRKLTLNLEPEVLFGQTSNRNSYSNSHSHSTTSTTSSSSSNNNNNNRSSHSSSNNSVQQEEQEIPWWILEYKCPPPGHLGAHSVPVSSSKHLKESAKLQEKKSRRSLLGAFLETHRK
jgi:hypothetical protein